MKQRRMGDLLAIFVDPWENFEALGFTGRIDDAKDHLALS